MSVYVTSDLHLYHDAVLKLCRRPFKDMNKMHKVIHDNWNAVVTNDDIVIIVGDITLKGSDYKTKLERYFSSLNGTKIGIFGNHDKLKPFQYIDIGFQSMHTSLVFDEFIFVHDPAVATIDKTKKFICGHVHDLFVKCDNCVNVGVDVWDYTPVPLDKVKELFFDERKFI